MPLTTAKAMTICRALSEEYDRQSSEHYRLYPPAGAIPVGGAHMDSFFRMEALLGAMQYLRQGGRSLAEAQEAGDTASVHAVRRWNASRPKEYQVHRWEHTAQDFLRSHLRFRHFF